MNSQLVESIVQVVLSLSQEERTLLEERLFFSPAEPSTRELMQLAQNSTAFDFLHSEPAIYTLEDGDISAVN